MMPLTSEENKNNQLLLDLYFLAQRIQRQLAETDVLMEKYNIALELTRGRKWIVESNLQQLE